MSIFKEEAKPVRPDENSTYTITIWPTVGAPPLQFAGCTKISMITGNDGNPNDIEFFDAQGKWHTLACDAWHFAQE